MNICFLCREYNSSIGRGGIGTFTYIIASALAKLGHKVFIITVSNKQQVHKMDNLIVFSTKLFYIPFFARFSKLLGLDSLYLRLINAFSNFLALRKLTKIYKIDIVEYPDWFAEGLFIKLIKKIPSVVRIHGTLKTFARYLPDKNRVRFFLISIIENIAIKHANGIIFPSKQLLVNTPINVRFKKNKIIYHPFHPPEKVPPIQKIEKVFRITCVGRIEPRKNQEVVIKALPLVLKKIRDVELILIGRLPWPSYKKYIFRLIEELKIEKYIKFIGEVTWDEMYGWLLSSDIICIPSKSESFGYSFVEALSSNRPVVASDIPVFKEIVKENNLCIFVNPDDYKKWAEQIIFLYENKELGQQLAKKAKLFVEQEFSSEKIAAECIEFYKEIISSYAR